MNSPLISVIVPVYNAEKTLHRCVDSLLEQTFKNFEVLLIDDGSADSSGTICDFYSGMDSRVRVIHKKNGGVSSARQIGVNAALGLYVIHADSDDWVEKDMLEILYQSATMNAADLVIADFKKELNGNVSECIQPECETSNELLHSLLENKSMGALWNKLIKKDLYRDVQFDLDVFFCEDLLLLCKILKNKEPKISYIHKSCYHYIMNRGSITNTMSKKTFENRFLFIQKLQQIFNDSNERLNDLFRLQKLDVVIWMFRSLLYPSKDVIALFDSFYLSGALYQDYADLFEKKKNEFVKWRRKYRFPFLVKIKRVFDR
ncbi:MAG: glycosyltransferase family 2 protein [Fibrobacter sp.]|nr:glycosyltransferase family 2 protein [Fibrobacter sp.]